MDIFSACVAFGPVAIYLLLLGAINVSRRPLVVTGTRETVSWGLALSGMVAVGPMQLFMPPAAAGRFGPWVWLPLISFYVLCLTLVILLSRPRLVVYNVEPERLRIVLAETALRVDPDATWAGASLSMPLARVHLHLEDFAPLGNVSLVATGDEQSIGNWRRLELALRRALEDVPAFGQVHGLWMLMCCVAIL